MKTVYHNKLVRDKIPQIIAQSGNTCITHQLDPQAYLKCLDEKLNEELAEYQSSKQLEELADLLEVMTAVVAARGYTWEQLTALQAQKREARGGFFQRIFLQSVTSEE